MHFPSWKALAFQSRKTQIFLSLHESTWSAVWKCFERSIHERDGRNCRKAGHDVMKNESEIRPSSSALLFIRPKILTSSQMNLKFFLWRCQQILVCRFRILENPGLPSCDETSCWHSCMNECWSRIACGWKGKDENNEKEAANAATLTHNQGHDWSQIWKVGYRYLTTSKVLMSFQEVLSGREGRTFGLPYSLSARFSIKLTSRTVKAFLKLSRWWTVIFGLEFDEKARLAMSRMRT